MASKPFPKKVVKNEDRVKIGSILDKEGFLHQHDNCEIAKKIMKGFEDNGLLIFVSFDYRRVHKKGVLNFFSTLVWGMIKFPRLKEKKWLSQLKTSTLNLSYHQPQTLISQHTPSIKKCYGMSFGEGALSFVKFTVNIWSLMLQELMTLQLRISLCYMILYNIIDLIGLDSFSVACACSSIRE